MSDYPDLDRLMKTGCDAAAGAAILMAVVRFHRLPHTDILHGKSRRAVTARDMAIHLYGSILGEEAKRTARVFAMSASAVRTAERRVQLRLDASAADRQERELLVSQLRMRGIGNELREL